MPGAVECEMVNFVVGVSILPGWLRGLGVRRAVTGCCILNRLYANRVVDGCV